MKQFYVTKNSEQLGPFAEAHIEEKVAAGELSASDLCWTEGMQEWKPLHAAIKLPEVAPPRSSEPDMGLAERAQAVFRTAADGAGRANEALDKAKWWIRIPITYLMVITLLMLIKWIFG